MMLTWTFFGDYTIVSEKKNVFEVHRSSRQAQEEVFSGVSSQEGHLKKIYIFFNLIKNIIGNSRLRYLYKPLKSPNIIYNILNFQS